MLETPPCCCLALDVLAGKDLLKSSFIVEISSSHNSSLKTLTGSIMLSSPQDALSYTRGAAWLWARQREGISVLFFFPMSLYCLAFSQNFSCTTQAVFRHFTHKQNFCTVVFDRTIANWICDCQHSSCVLERPDLLETCSMEMQSSVLGRRPQLCAEKVLWWGLSNITWPQLVVLRWRKVILQHRSTLQCPLPPQQCSEEEYLLSVLGWYNTLVSTLNWT